MKPNRMLTVTAAAIVALLPSGTATAADTIETWDQGAVDFELYAGADGLGLARNERSIFADTTLGYGIVDRFSGYLRGSGAGDEQLADGQGEVGVGLFGTPVDSRHVDLDLILDFGLSSAGPAITPAVEINFDAEPDLAYWGAYLRAEERFAGRQPEAATDPSPAADPEPDPSLAPETTATLGGYVTVAEGHQLLVEVDGGLRNSPANGEDAVDLGGIAAGYNVAVHESIELINQVYVDLPVRQADELAFGVAIGFVATIDPGGEPTRDPTAPAAKARPKRLSSYRSER